uniref:ATP synthase F0 subunit 8 n=1 Tax=Typhlocyba sp. EMHAU-15062510 TaxID=2040465 RepID=A0A343KGQ4_9HEMI|nr:ATP synthase F0 subunit 8 [Typhlocyba sp. EMHAU-15062510]
MPQMSPMWWTMLMMMFIMSFIMCMYIMYFNSNKYSTMTKKMVKKNLNWTWYFQYLIHAQVYYH